MSTESSPTYHPNLRTRVQPQVPPAVTTTTATKSANANTAEEVGHQQQAETLLESQTAGENAQPQVQQQTKRGRGRPRKTDGQTEMQAPQIQQQEQTVLREDIEGSAQTLPERRVTRQMVREGTAQLTEAQIEAVKQPSILQWRPAVSQGPQYLCNQYGLPLIQKGTKSPHWLSVTKRKLKRLQPHQRNKLLTGDSGFPFDYIQYQDPLVLYKDTPQEESDSEAEEEEAQPEPQQGAEQPHSPPRARSPSPARARSPSPARARSPPRRTPSPNHSNSNSSSNSNSNNLGHLSVQQGQAESSGLLQHRERANHNLKHGLYRLLHQGPSTGRRASSSGSLGAKAKSVFQTLTRVPPPPGARPPQQEQGPSRIRTPSLRAREAAEQQAEEELRRLSMPSRKTPRTPPHK